MALNDASGNSITENPAGQVPNDGTGMFEALKTLKDTADIFIFTGIVQLDPWLEPFKPSLQSRYAKAQQWLKTINDTEGGLEKFTRVSIYASSRIQGR